MTDAEKAQALYAITMTEATKLQAQQTRNVDDSADKLERLEAKYKNITTSVATFMKTLVVGSPMRCSRISQWWTPILPP